jgi:hypothetical protein
MSKVNFWERDRRLHLSIAEELKDNNLDVCVVPTAFDQKSFNIPVSWWRDSDGMEAFEFLLSES